LVVSNQRGYKEEEHRIPLRPYCSTSEDYSYGILGSDKPSPLMVQQGIETCSDIKFGDPTGKSAHSSPVQSEIRSDGQLSTTSHGTTEEENLSRCPAIPRSGSLSEGLPTRQIHYHSPI